MTLFLGDFIANHMSIEMLSLSAYAVELDVTAILILCLYCYDYFCNHHT